MAHAELLERASEQESEIEGGEEMKILNIFNHYLERGGEEIVIEKICDSLSKTHQVQEFSLYSADWKEESLFGKVTQPLRMFYNPASVRRLKLVLKDFQPDLVLFHNVFPVGSLWLYRIVQGAGIPSLQYIHNFRPFSVSGYCWAGGKIVESGFELDFRDEVKAGAWQNSRIKTLIFSRVLMLGHRLGVWKSMTGWIAISEFMRKKFIGGGIAGECCVALRHPWFEDEQDEVLLEGSDELAGRSFLFMGRLTEEKGVMTLLAAWDRVEAATDLGELVIAGSGPLEEAVRERALNLDRVRLVGFVSGAEKVRLLGEAAGMVVPSQWWEPLGLVTYESYSRGKPVFAANSGGLAEVIVDGETGWVHRPGDQEQLAEHFLEALSDPEEVHRRGRQGRKWLKNHASIDEWEKELNGLLEKFAGRRNG